MEYDQEKVDEMTMALLYLVSTDLGEGLGARAWKGWDAATINRLVAKGWIMEPKRKSLTFEITSPGFERSRELFNRYFSIVEE